MESGIELQGIDSSFFILIESPELPVVLLDPLVSVVDDFFDGAVPDFWLELILEVQRDTTLSCDVLEQRQADLVGLGGKGELESFLKLWLVVQLLVLRLLLRHGA